MKLGMKISGVIHESIAFVAQIRLEGGREGRESKSERVRKIYPISVIVECGLCLNNESTNTFFFYSYSRLKKLPNKGRSQKLATDQIPKKKN